MCTCTETHAPTAIVAPVRRGGVSKRKRAGVVFSAGVLMLGGGVAWAAWTHSGTGTANAQAATAGNLVVTAGSPVAALYPLPTGGYTDPAVGAVYTTVANPNSYPVRITTATLGAPVVTAAGANTCAASNVVATNGGTVTLASPVTLPANAPATQVVIPGALQMIPTAPDGCQGATVSVPVTVTGATA